MSNKPSPQSYRELLEDATQTLYADSPTPRIDSEILLQEVIDQPLSWIFAYGDTIATPDHVKRFFELIARRHQGQPIAYLLGYKDFWTLRLKVDPNVLIPRSDTETLVEHALEKYVELEQGQILDLGTGSGAIALALAKERPRTQVTATDYSAAALKIAKDNAMQNGISNVRFLQSDWFSGISDDEKFDLIVSNPPYVESGDPHLLQGDLRFEPDSALIAEGDGLSDLGKIIHCATSYLLPEGWLMVEHGYKQANEVEKLFADSGFSNIELYEDINNLPRCTAGQMRLA